LLAQLVYLAAGIGQLLSQYILLIIRAGNLGFQRFDSGAGGLQLFCQGQVLIEQGFGFLGAVLRLESLPKFHGVCNLSWANNQARNGEFLWKQS
jgi:hypothetical protein